MEKPDFTSPMEFCATNGHMRYAGIHRPVEIRSDRFLDSLAETEEIMEGVARVCGAVLRKADLLEFHPYGGMTGIAVPQEVAHRYP